jgi:hypothetical protein
MTLCRLLLTALAAVCLGCQPRPPVTYQSRQQLDIKPDLPSTVQIWEAAKDTLRSHSFPLDRVDRRAGVITTRPEISKQYFEFWRKDVATWRGAWEATLNPIRRWVEVRITPASSGETVKVTVAVYKQRLSAPDRQFNSSGAAYQFFGDELPSTTGAPSVTEEDERWIDRGRDHAMEDLLLEEILRKAGWEFEESGESTEDIES